ncbi:phosphotransferase enzyme family protein [Acetobacter oeni]|nr:phosphotransferase [Acetobacter oeni]MBB3883896.1 Ser/Thr protein kinase RdoA (MazF antagonist) [Acetobacter oeni]NHO19819.1 phosphotransferase [Acetobacter oeni]
MSSTHYAHGLGNDLKRPDWPEIRLPELENVLSQFPSSGSPQDILWRSPRPFSSAAEVKTSKGSLFVKRHHHSVRSVADLTEEHRFIGHLRQHHVPVVNILIARNGETAIADDIWTYEVYQPGRGYDFYRDSPSWTAFAHDSHAFAAGQMLAKFHQAAVTYQAPPRQTKLLVASNSIFGSPDPLRILKAELSARPALARFFSSRSWETDINQRLIIPFHANAYALLHDEPPLWTHGDWHASNLLWSSSDNAGHVQTILDFGLSDRTFALFDLATAIERNLISWLDAENGSGPVGNLGQLDALLNGYNSVSPLSIRAVKKLSAILPLVHADFALSEIDYFSGILRNEADAQIAYDQFLLGHADWFREREGEVMLGHLDKFARRLS